MKLPITAFLLCASLTIPCGMALAQTAAPIAPDNSAVNVRDRGQGAMTADQQGQDKNDLELSARIRRAVEKDHALSMMARNVKIITADGQVILRGPVKTAAEKATIGKKADRIAGADKVDNQLAVKGE